MFVVSRVRCAERFARVRPALTFLVALLGFLFLNNGPAIAQGGYHYAGSIATPMPAQFHYIQAVATDRQANIYVADLSGRIQKFDRSGRFLFSCGKKGKGDGAFDFLFALTIDRYQNIYAVDLTGRAVQKFDRNGHFLLRFGSQGEGDGQFGEPTGIAVNDVTGDIIVADDGRLLIHRFDKKGRFRSAFGKFRTFESSTSRRAMSVAFDNTGALLVTNLGRNWDETYYQVERYDQNGALLSRFAEEGAGPGQVPYVYSMTTDRNGLVYLGGGSSKPVSIFDQNGVFKRQFGTQEVGYPYPVPQGVAADLLGGVWIADAANAHVVRYDQSGAIQKVFGEPYPGPTVIRADAADNLYIVGNPYTATGQSFPPFIQKFDAKGDLKLRFKQDASEGEAYLNSITGLSVNRAGDIAALDLYRRRVQLYDAAGAFKYAFGKFGQQVDEFRFPIDMARNSADEFLILDETSIKKFSATGTFLDVFYPGPDGGFSALAPASDDSFFATFNYLYSPGEIIHFSPTGVEIARFGKDEGSEFAIKNYSGIAVDRGGNLFVTDSRNGRVVKFDTQGKKTAEFGNAGPPESRIDGSSSITTDSKGRVFVTDAANLRVAIFEPDTPKLDVVRQPRPTATRDNATGELRIAFTVTNVGTGPAQTPRITSASLNGVAPLDAIPYALPPLPAGGKGAITLRFPGTAAPAGPGGVLTLFLVTDGVKTYASMRTNRIP